jgi:hypothetical protein
MKLMALTAGPLSEVEQADARLTRMKRPAKRFKLVIDGGIIRCVTRVLSGDLTVPSIVGYLPFGCQGF